MGDKLQPCLDPCFETWSRQGSGYVFISHKDRASGAWEDSSFRWPGGKEQIVKAVGDLQGSTCDVYWAPLVFSRNKRKKEYAKRSNILYADLDPVDPRTLPIRPTVAWESSEGRFQCIWWLKDKLESPDMDRINQALSYSVGADKGGWDITQVLRIPDTMNYKYSPPKQGKLMWSEDKVYGQGEFPQKKPESSTDGGGGESDTSLIKLLHKYRKVIPRKVSQKLQYPESRVGVGSRSDVLWFLESELVKAQIPIEDIANIIRLSVWNKYKGRNDEWTRITTEISKIYSTSTSNSESGATEPTEQEDEEDGEDVLPWVSFPTLMGSLNHEPGWLIKDVWLKRSHGMVAGEPKSFKSTIVMDMAICIAAGVPWNGFETMESGPVLIIQNENSEWIMKDRMTKIMETRGLIGRVKALSKRQYIIEFVPDLPITFLNNFGYSFSDPLHQELLEKAVAEVKPVLIVFDPLYLMFEGDINLAKELYPVLNWLLHIKNDYKSAVMLIHHWNKGGSSYRGGQRMLGSTTLHGWTESALYLETKEDCDQPTIVVEREFRGAGMYPKMEMTLGMGDDYNPQIVEVSKDSSLLELLDIMSNYPRGVSIKQVMKDLGISREKITKLISTSGGKLMIDGNKIVPAEERNSHGKRGQ